MYDANLSEATAQRVIEKWYLNTGCILICNNFPEELTVVVNDRWSLNAGGRLSRFDCSM